MSATRLRATGTLVPLVRRSPQFLPSRSAWSGGDSGIEDGYGTAPSARDGFVGAYDTEGRMIAERTVGKGLTVVQAVLPKGSGETVYARVGDLWGWVCVAGTAGLAGWVLWPRARPRAALS
jgi:apolipoprotein N-acyltransferase